MFRLFAKKLPREAKQGILESLLPALEFGECILKDGSIQSIHPEVTGRIDNSSQQVELLSLFAAELPQTILSKLRDAPPNRRPFFVETVILTVAKGAMDRHLLFMALLFTKYMMEIELMLQARANYPREDDLWEKVDLTGQLLAAAYSHATGANLLTVSSLAPDFAYAYAPGGRFAA